MAIAISSEGKGMRIAVSDLTGKICRLERFPKGDGPEETRSNLSSALMRLLRGSKPSICGAAVASDDDMEWLKSFLPFPVTILPTSSCRARAELSRCEIDMRDTLFIDLSEKAEAVCYDGTFRRLPCFGDITVQNGTTLNETFTLGRIWRDWGPVRRDRVWEDGEIAMRMKADLPKLAEAIAKSVEVICPARVMITGALSSMDDSFYAYLNERTRGLGKRGIVIFRSLAGEGGTLEGAAALALDGFFYRTDMLMKLSELERM